MAKLPKEYRKYIGKYEKAPSLVKVALRKAGYGPTVVEPVVEENVIRIDKWISQEKLAEHLVNINHGIKGMLSFLNDCMPSLGKMQ